LAWYTRQFGASPTFVNGHQHVHVLRGIRSAIAPVLACYDVKYTRIPDERQPIRAVCPVCALVQSECAAAREEYRSAGVYAADGFVGSSFCGVAYSLEDFVESVTRQISCQTAASNRPVAVEVMVHPGNAGTGWDAFNESPLREHELSVLLDAHLSEALRSICRISNFSDSSVLCKRSSASNFSDSSVQCKRNSDDDIALVSPNESVAFIETRTTPIDLDEVATRLTLTVHAPIRPAIATLLSDSVRA
jgi:hypothetical protein